MIVTSSIVRRLLVWNYNQTGGDQERTIFASNINNDCLTRARLILLKSYVALSFKVCHSSVCEASVSPDLTSTDQVTSITNWYRLILTQYHLVPTIAIIYWPSTQLHHLVTRRWVGPGERNGRFYILPKSGFWAKNSFFFPKKHSKCAKRPGQDNRFCTFGSIVRLFLSEKRRAKKPSPTALWITVCQ